MGVENAEEEEEDEETKEDEKKAQKQKKAQTEKKVQTEKKAQKEKKDQPEKKKKSRVNFKEHPEDEGDFEAVYENNQLESNHHKLGVSQESAAEPNISALLSTLNISQEEHECVDHEEDKDDDCNNNSDKLGHKDEASYMPLHPSTKRGRARQPPASSTGLRRSARS